MSEIRTFSMPAPWGGLSLTEKDGELACIRPTFLSVKQPDICPEEIAYVMHELEAILAVPRQPSQDVLNFLFEKAAFKKLPPFSQNVLKIVTFLDPGQWMTYTQVAEALNSPAAARAVGQALARNPFPVLIGCHRVCSLEEASHFDIMRPETLRPRAYLGKTNLTVVAQYLRLLDLTS